MKRTISRSAILTAAAIIACMAGPAAAQSTAARTGGVPYYEVEPGWPKVPPKWKLGPPSSIGIDAQDRIWVLHRPRGLPPADAAMAAPPVMVFDAAGNFVQGWGGAGTGYEWPDIEHGIHIDYKGFVWLGGNNCPGRPAPGIKPIWDDQLLKFTQDGKFVLQIGRSNASTGNADTRNLHGPADAYVYRKTNEVFVADGYFNHRVIVFDADSGEFRRMWGAFGNKPEGKAICPPVGLKSVPDGAGPDQFQVAHAIRVSNDGMVYVADRENRRVQAFTIDGKFVKQLIRHNAPFARNIALSRDPEQRFLFVGGGIDIVIVERKTMEIVDAVGGPGFLGGGHQMAADAKGNLYIAATTRGLQKLELKGMK